MQWECHECGHQHATMPEACERCGARPEIVENIWRCAHCGAQDIPGGSQRCPACGADRGLDVETAVGSHKLEGDVARKLASGDWLYCAYCDVQVPPVDAQGTPLEECPTCKGPLSEATVMAADEELSADAAGAYRKQATRRKGEPAPRAPAPKKRSRLPLVLGVVGLAVVGIVLYFVLRGPDQYRVVDRHWTCNQAVERFGPQQQEAWFDAVPAGAYARSCSRQIHHHDKVPNGTETVHERVASGRHCASYGFKKRGGVSVKTCQRWETDYREVTRTRTRYRRVPVYRQKCRYTLDTWHVARTLSASGTSAEEPHWPAVDRLADKERVGAKTGIYTLVLQRKEARKEHTCSSLEEWKRFPKNATVLVETSLGGTVKSVRPAK